MSQRREKRFRQLERRVTALEVQAKENREEKMVRSIEAAVRQSCMDADWEPATNAETPRRGLIERIKRVWKAWKT